MASTGTLALSIKERRPLTPTYQALIDTLRTKANWIWCPDPGPDPPSAPEWEQCIFRRRFFYAAGKGRATKATVVIDADDYMALYVDGVMIQVADMSHSWKLLYAFEVPLPVIQHHQTSAPSFLLGLRGVNIDGNVGLIAVVQVDYDAGESDVFYTGLDENWRAQRVFDEGWEQPWYSSNTWRSAHIIPQSARAPSDQVTTPGEVTVLEALSAVPASSGMNPGRCGGAPTGLSVGLFTGVLVSSILLSLVFGAVGTYFFPRRRNPHQPIDAWPDSGGVASGEHGLIMEPLQLPNEPQPSMSNAQPDTNAPANDSYRLGLHPSLPPFTQDTSQSTSPAAYTAPPTCSDLGYTPALTPVRRK